MTAVNSHTLSTRDLLKKLYFGNRAFLMRAVMSKLIRTIKTLHVRRWGAVLRTLILNILCIMIQINDARQSNFTEVLVYSVKANLKGNNIFALFSFMVFHYYGCLSQACQKLASSGKATCLIQGTYSSRILRSQY